jgi:hypothetical protein
MWTLSRPPRSGRGSAAGFPRPCSWSAAPSPRLRDRNGAEAPTFRQSGERLYARPRGLASMAPCFSFRTPKAAAHIWMGEALPYKNSCHVFAVGFQ